MDISRRNPMINLNVVIFDLAGETFDVLILTLAGDANFDILSNRIMLAHTFNYNPTLGLLCRKNCIKV